MHGGWRDTDRKKDNRRTECAWNTPTMCSAAFALTSEKNLQKDRSTRHRRHDHRFNSDTVVKAIRTVTDHPRSAIEMLPFNYQPANLMT